MAHFSEFTRKYSLSKTLRFELKPVGETLENMRNQMYGDKKNFDSNLQTFLYDQEIEDAYQTLKPILDKLHEEFIDISLNSFTAKNIHFSEYLEVYKERGNDVKTDEKSVLSGIENNLRKEIGKTYLEGAKSFIEQAKMFGGIIDEVSDSGEEGDDDEKKTKGLFKKKNFELLTETGVLIFIKKRLDSMNLNEQEKTDIAKALETFKGFFTYFTGFNQNRENYYAVDKEKSTAIATRIVHENLPKFCDNIIFFEKRKEEYLGIYAFLKSKNIDRQIMDAESGKMVELYSITEDIFDINYFSSCLSQCGIEIKPKPIEPKSFLFCLSQGGIDNYNRIIGHYNALINLYNQAHKKDEKFTKLPLLKELYKQIGCGKKGNWIKSITHDTDEQILADKNHTGEAISVEHMLRLAEKAGKKYFMKGDNVDDIVITVPAFLDWLKERNDWSGIYWSKSAINSISNIYFPSWESIKLSMKGDKTLVSYDKKREEQIKINEAVELSGLFGVLDAIVGNDWKKEGAFFRLSLTKLLDESKENEAENIIQRRRLSIIHHSSSPSKALVALIADFIEENIKNFLNQSDIILNLSEYNSSESKEAIKIWMDMALSVNQAIRYFRVKESKTKGETINSELTSIIANLLDAKDATWFEWYDLLRNYLTKKPQDDAKENKLKLNFESGSLLGGWSDGQEKIKKAVLIRKEGNFYIGILKKNSLFDTEKENNPIYETSENSTGRLILANLKFQTLAGKGFLGEFKQSYGDMGKTDPNKAVESLQKIIRDRYQKKHPLLARIAKTSYVDKKDFDKDIQETLKECYVCEFRNVNWSKIQEAISLGELYLFQISSKDNGVRSKGKKNLQTLYWEVLFMENSPFQLNGGAEIFYRKEAIKMKELKELKIKNPSAIVGKRFTKNLDLEPLGNEDQILQEKNGKSFFFHCPIKINYKATGSSNFKFALSETNQFINSQLSSKSDIYFLGLDRGEKHLVYYSIVDQNGKMILGGQGSFNEIKGKNYHTLLTEREGERMESRKNWQTIGNIAKLKEGYISLVIHEIIEKLKLNPGFIVMEDLNTGFKRGRQKIEKSIYQKFELALAKKLNFVVDKSAKLGEIGSVTNALQLTPPVSNYGEIENQKQVGIMLYTRANYTSQTDPATGWRKTIYLKTGSEENIKEQIVTQFTDFGFDGQDYYFEYVDKIGKKWRIYSGKAGKSLTRFRGKRGTTKNEWKIEEIDISKMLDEIFVDFDKNHSFLSQILDEKMEIKRIDEKHTAWESLRFVIDLIQQIRNAGDKNRGEDDNFLLSPVRDEYGNHFDTREQREGLPKDADANGAYNIARKGIIMNEHIRYNTDSKDIDLFISDEEWDLWLTDKKKWEDMLPIFSSRKAMEKYRSGKSKKS